MHLQKYLGRPSKVRSLRGHVTPPPPTLSPLRGKKKKNKSRKFLYTQYHLNRKALKWTILINKIIIDLRDIPTHCLNFLAILILINLKYILRDFCHKYVKRFVEVFITYIMYSYFSTTNTWRLKCNFVKKKYLCMDFLSLYLQKVQRSQEKFVIANELLIGKNIWFQ